MRNPICGVTEGVGMMDGAGQQVDGANVSFEFFPPKGLAAERAVMTGSHALRHLKPVAHSVTCAAGSEDAGPEMFDDTLVWSRMLQSLTGVPSAAHVPLSIFGRDALERALDALEVEEIDRIVLLRGDAGTGADCFAGYGSVAEALAAIKRKRRFDVGVAAYPEVHPKAASPTADLDVLLAKIDAGADRIITQYFFEEGDFLRLRDAVERARPRAVLTAGIMPVRDFARIARFSERCGAGIPDWMRRDFDSIADDREASSDMARRLICRQVEGLAREGVRDIHIYTLNRVDLAADAVRAFRSACPPPQREDRQRLSA